MICLATPRLLLRTWRADDGDDLDVLLDPATTAVGNLRQVADLTTSDLIESLNDAWSHDGFGIFAIESVDDGHLLGVAGLAPEPGHQRSLELLWRIGASNPGTAAQRSTDDLVDLAAEALRALIDWGFGLLDVDVLATTFTDDNAPASRVATSIGLGSGGRTIDPLAAGWLQRHTIALAAWRDGTTPSDPAEGNRGG